MFAAGRGRKIPALFAEARRVAASDIDPVSRMLGELNAELRRSLDERQRLFELLDKHGDVLAEQGAVLQHIKGNVDALAGKDGRVAKVEAVAADYTRTKNRMLGLLSGALFGGAGAGAGLHEVFKRWLG